ncbi:MAG: cellobiose phosphorylase [Tepidisphaeraceae bacterium]
MGEISIDDLAPAITPEHGQFELADESDFHAHVLGSEDGVTIKALPNGCIYAIERGDILINQVLASPVAGGIHRIYLRIRENGGYSFVEIIGPGARGDFAASRDRFLWTGAWRGIHYRCTCWVPHGDAWVFQVAIENCTANAVNCDAVLIQDIGLAERAQVRNNERYISQYLDHFAVPHAELGHLLMTRQNLPQGQNKHPWLLHGCFPACAGFCTDAFDFFGVTYKATGIPTALSLETIGQCVRQYEAGCAAIQSNPVEISPGDSHSWSFFAFFSADHPQPSSAADIDGRALRKLRLACEKMAGAPDRTIVPARTPIRGLFHTAELFQAKDFEEGEIRKCFPSPLRHEEFDGRRRLSFFFGADSRHVVLKSKELVSVRPHGHIMRSGQGLMPDAEVMSCTSYAAGIFAGQMALGNTVLGKFLSGVRDSLNIVRSCGLRIFVRQRPTDPWKLLGVPSAYEMGLNFCRWYYKGNRNLLTVTCQASDEDAAFIFSVHSDKHTVELLFCGEISAGPHEYDSSPSLSIDSQRARIIILPDRRSLLAERMPAIAFHAVSSTRQAIDTIGGEELIERAQGSPPLPYFAIRSRPTASFSLCFFGMMDDTSRANSLCAKYESVATESPLHSVGSGRFWKNAAPEIRIFSPSSARAAEIQDALVWFAHNAIIHLSVPRGLEQANGGAWGVRDVCQGPVEFLLSYDRADVVKNIIHELFSQQYCRRGDWPQWFMFPPFHQIQASTSHGDILIWPLKALCDYLEHTNDGDVLQHTAPYTDDETFERGQERETIVQHVDRLMQRMHEQFLPGLSLPRYGEGDWDDSLQPTTPTLGDRMASSWTVALMYHTLRRYAAALARFGEEERAAMAAETAAQIKADFQRYLMPDGVVAGFAIFDPDPTRAPHYLLHPSDSQTGIQYRLISITRGILSGIFSPQQAKHHMGLVKKHLLFPDGARLMDRPTVYQGGRELVFHRSESAAFFGREIGLQYVHAHLRYAEALAAMGLSQDLLHALALVNPINVTDVVKNALPRQRNCYFSSSDAAFKDRYEASRDYDKLREGKIPVEGGWRIYSSGPGVYANLVIRHLFGLRRHFDCMEFDPVLPREFNGICCEMAHNGRKVRYQFRRSGNARSVKRISINGVEVSSFSRVESRYRPGGVRIKKAEFEAALALTENIIQIDT